MGLRINICEGEYAPDQWLAWGEVLRWNGTEAVGDYFIVRLPSWTYEPNLWSGFPSWHQLALTGFGAKGKPFKWKLARMPTYERR